jgi:hypothetical protein
MRGGVASPGWNSKKGPARAAHQNSCLWRDSPAPRPADKKIRRGAKFSASFCHGARSSQVTCVSGRCDMNDDVRLVLPCAIFFRSGRRLDGFLNLLLQLTVIFWPVALAWAREVKRAHGVTALLSEISVTYKVPFEQMRKSGKTFARAT